MSKAKYNLLQMFGGASPIHTFQTFRTQYWWRALIALGVVGGISHFIQESQIYIVDEVRGPNIYLHEHLFNIRYVMAHCTYRENPFYYDAAWRQVRGWKKNTDWDDGPTQKHKERFEKAFGFPPVSDSEILAKKRLDGLGLTEEQQEKLTPDVKDKLVYLSMVKEALKN